MKTNFLFPYKCQYAGYAFILTAIPLFLIDQDRFFLPVVFLTLIGLILIAFSKEKIEDEQIIQMRSNALQWAIYLNYLILLVSLVFYHGNDVGQVLKFNLKFLLLIFIIRFKWMIFRLNRASKQEKLT